MRYAALILILLAGTANAEVWECQAGTYWGPNDKVLIIATSFDEDFGTIEVAGTRHITEYAIHGFDRRWDFGDKTDQATYSYAFVISTTGLARYYDFTLADEDGRVNSSETYFCKQTKQSDPEQPQT